jgi:hypothetical protein
MGFPVVYGNLCSADILVYMQNNFCTWHIIPVRPITLYSGKTDDSSTLEYTENCVITHHFQGKGLEANIQQAVRQVDKYDLVVFQPVSLQLYNLLASGRVTFGTVLTGVYF